MDKEEVLQAKLAEHIGVDSSHLGRCLNKRTRTLNIDQLERAFVFLNIKLS